MPIDRAATLRSAEKFLRQGRLEPAIAEYLRISQSRPSDWKTANLVGDLYVRAGKVEQAIEQFAAIADRLSHDGLLSQASAVYKKIVRLRPEHEHALLRCAEIAAAQGVLVDARTFLGAVADRRLARGDRQGAAQVSVTLGELDSKDYPARIRGAHASAELGDAGGAVSRLQEIAAELLGKERPAEAAEALRNALSLAPDDDALRGRLIAVLVDVGQWQEAQEYAQTSTALQLVAGALEDTRRPDQTAPLLEEGNTATVTELSGLEGDLAVRGAGAGHEERASAERVGLNPGTMWLDAQRCFIEGRADEGRQLLHEVLRQDPARRQDVALLGLSISQTDRDSAFQLIDLAADAAIAEGDWESAAAGLQELLTRGPSHLPALMRLVEISVDGDLSATMYTAQAQLADAYLEAGAAHEAHFIAEDLVAREPWERAHLERIRRALVMLGEPDPDAVIARRLSGESPFVSIDVTVSAALCGTLDAGPTLPFNPRPNAECPAAPSPSAVSLPELERALQQLRQNPSRRDTMTAADEDFERGLERYSAGEVDESITLLTKASSATSLRFVTAALLARIHREQGLRAHAMVWFEQAVQAPPPSPAEGHALLYEFADWLESMGAGTRALDTFTDLQAQAPEYRDVTLRVASLTPASGSRVTS